MNPFVIELSDIIINPDADYEGEWVLNENHVFGYVLSSSNDKSNNKDVLIKKLSKTLALQIPVCSGLPNDSLIRDPADAMVVVRAKHN